MATSEVRKYKRQQSKLMKSKLASFHMDEQQRAAEMKMPECPVCFEYICHESKVAKCGHCYCLKCYKKLQNNRCAICRCELRKPRRGVANAPPLRPPAPQPIVVQGVLNSSDQVPHLFRCTHAMIFAPAHQCEVAHLTRDILTHAITHSTRTSFDATMKMIQDFMLKSVHKCCLISDLTHQNWLGELASQRLREEEER